MSASSLMLMPAGESHPLSTTVKGWRLVRYIGGCGILRSSDAAFRFVAIAPTTRGDAGDFRGFVIFYVPTDDTETDTASVVEVPKDELQRTLEQLVELGYIKRDQDEEAFIEIARRWYTGLKIVDVTIVVPVVKTRGFVPIAAFDRDAHIDVPIISGNLGSPRPPLDDPVLATPKSSVTKRPSDDALETSADQGTASKRRAARPPSRYAEFEFQKSETGTTQLNKKH